MSRGLKLKLRREATALFNISTCKDWHSARTPEERTAKLKADVPILEGIMAKTWGKEDELKQLKLELAAFDRKIAVELAPKHNEKDGEEVKPNTQQQQSAKVIEAPPSSQSQSINDKKSMVSEPATPYRSIDYSLRGTPRSIGL